MRRALVSLPEGVWKIIDEQLRGEMGDKDSEIIRNIVIAFLTQQGYFASQSVNEKNRDSRYYNIIFSGNT